MNFQGSTPEIVAGAAGNLLGKTQTVPRSELFAAVYAAEATGSNALKIYSGCKYLTDKAKRSRPRSNLIKNGDLWQRYWQAVEAKGGQVRVVKVKAHCDGDDIINGITKYRELAGNIAADAFAVRGAKKAQVPAAVALEVEATDTLAFKIQSRIAALICHHPTKDADARDALQHRAFKKARNAAKYVEEKQSSSWVWRRL